MVSIQRLLIGFISLLLLSSLILAATVGIAGERLNISSVIIWSIRIPIGLFLIYILGWAVLSFFNDDDE
jgi:hypothetical protein